MEQGTTHSQRMTTAAAVHVRSLQSSADGGRSLSDVAQRDLDAALQLLADRALYITGSTGAAIALRRVGKNDMLCRASTGTNAPELGALLSTEVGLSGESVRTRRALRCDDAERDARVNRDVCREMGIASAIVMPVVNDDQVLGVFELFSGKANAFGERDLTALQRLSEMVETAVKLAQAAETVPPVVEESVRESEMAKLARQTMAPASAELKVQTVAASVAPSPGLPTTAPDSQPASAPKKPLFWSAAAGSAADAASSAAGSTDQSHVPPVLRNLRKCDVCGFPVSPGRDLCVECEEKKWRGQLRRNAPPPTRSTPAIAPVLRASNPEAPEFSVPVARLKAAAGNSGAAAAPAPAPTAVQGTFVADLKTTGGPLSPIEAKPAPSSSVSNATPSKPVAETTSVRAVKVPMPELVLSAATDPPQSWFSTNKYVFGALLIVAATVAAILLLR